MSVLRHPNIVMFLGACSQPPCMVTEYCARGSLLDILTRAREYPVRPYPAHATANHGHLTQAETSVSPHVQLLLLASSVKIFPARTTCAACKSHDL